MHTGRHRLNPPTRRALTLTKNCDTWPSVCFFIWVYLSLWAQILRLRWSCGVWSMTKVILSVLGRNSMSGHNNIPYFNFIPLPYNSLNLFYYVPITMFVSTDISEEGLWRKANCQELNDIFQRKIGSVVQSYLMSQQILKHYKLYKRPLSEIFIWPSKWFIPVRHSTTFHSNGLAEYCFFLHLSSMNRTHRSQNKQTTERNLDRGHPHPMLSTEFRPRRWYRERWGWGIVG